MAPSGSVAYHPPADVLVKSHSAAAVAARPFRFGALFVKKVSRTLVRQQFVPHPFRIPVRCTRFSSADELVQDRPDPCGFVIIRDECSDASGRCFSCIDDCTGPGVQSRRHHIPPLVWLELRCRFLPVQYALPGNPISLASIGKLFGGCTPE